jgi:tight adherence protein C
LELLQLGVPRDEALQALSDRTTITDLRIVLAAILQSGKYGLPLVEVLRVQTEELRDKRWQRAQERALKIPVKILFPLILCIFPAFFVVLLGPSLISLLQSL